MLPAESASLDTLFMNAHTRGVVVVLVADMGFGMGWLYGYMDIGAGIGAG